MGLVEPKNTFSSAFLNIVSAKISGFLGMLLCTGYPLGRGKSILIDEHRVPASGALTQPKAGFDCWAPVSWALRTLKEKLSKISQV